MGVRLNKVLTELEIGLQQAVDFLKARKGVLGDIKDDANVNTKISDEQYEALKRAFGQGKNYQRMQVFPFPKSQKIRCTHRDASGKECGYVNARSNSYCVKCGSLLDGRERMVIGKVDYEKLENKVNYLTEENEKLNGSVTNLNQNIVKMIVNGYAPQGYRLISNNEYSEIETLRQRVKVLNRTAEDNAKNSKLFEQRINALKEENKQLMTIIENEEKEIQQLKEGKEYNSIFVGGPKYDLMLKYVGAAKLQVVKAVKEAFNLGLKEAMDLVDGAPSVLKRGVSKSEAERLKKYIEAAGATVEIK